LSLGSNSLLLVIYLQLNVASIILTKTRRQQSLTKS
jgi:hypothetical protein